MSQVLIIGAGQAAASCAAALRSGGFEDGITIVGAEPVPPYQRPPLSKAYLLGDMALERLFLRPESWYADQNITLMEGRRIVALHPAEQLAELDGGDALPYDHCVLATGARPRQLPDAIGGDLDGVHYMRDLADADALAPHLEAGKRMVVIGGGYIGLEAAAVARKRGLDVVVVEAAERILQRVACAQTSAAMRALHESHGTQIIEGVGLSRLLGDNTVTGAALADGQELKADLAVVGIGVLPNVVLAESADLRVENGIAVDAQLGASHPGIWAIGDCASFPLGGVQSRLESVGNAIDMGELVAANIMGAGRDYAPKAWFWSDQYDSKLQIAGLGDGHDQVVVRQGDGVSHWYFRAGQLIAVDALDDPRAYMVGKRLIDAGRNADPQQLADPEVDLKALMR